MSVPELRFKDNLGRDFPEWQVKSIGGVLSIGSGKDYKHLSPGDVPVYGTGGYMLSVDDYLYDGESVCIGRKGTIDRPVLLNGRFWTVDTLFYTHSFKNCLPKFIYAAFQRIDWKNYNEASGVPSLSKSTIEKIEFSLPSIAEQTKIANFLTAVDGKITQLTQKHDLLSQYKKGVMQQIFSQELRFKDDDGREFSEWKEVTLENCANFFRGGSLSKADINEAGLYECIHYGELFTIYNEVISTVKSRTNNTNTFNSKYGDILMPSSDVTPAGLAKASCILKDGVVLGGDINIIRVNINISPIFISYLLNFDKTKIIQLVSGTTVKHIYIKDIKGIELSIPTSQKEQTKIANFLIAIDDKITQTQAELAAVKQYKQGLLQQMFV